jgi:hypothetical protein
MRSRAGGMVTGLGIEWTETVTYRAGGRPVTTSFTGISRL